MCGKAIHGCNVKFWMTLLKVKALRPLLYPSVAPSWNPLHAELKCCNLPIHKFLPSSLFLSLQVRLSQSPLSLSLFIHLSLCLRAAYCKLYRDASMFKSHVSSAYA